jgi:voltage-gated sodium channel
MRERVRGIVDGQPFQRFITAVIVFNAITLGLETSQTMVQRYGDALHVIDRAVVVIFVIELLARVYAYGIRFFRDPWNWFDAVIVTIAVLPTSGAFSVLRALRVLRVLRLISVVPSMQRVVGALLGALPGMASIAALLSLVLYVSAVIATKLYHDISPEYFGDLSTSLFTLFQTMTGEAWPDIARDVMSKEPMAWIFFVIYIVITGFTVLNLFIAVAVSAMESQVHERDAAEEAEDRADLDATLRSILTELRELRALHGAAAPQDDPVKA